MWNCVEGPLKIQINSENTASFVNYLPPMFYDQKELGDTRSVASETDLVI